MLLAAKGRQVRSIKAIEARTMGIVVMAEFHVDDWASGEARSRGLAQHRGRVPVGLAPPEVGLVLGVRFARAVRVANQVG